MMLFVCICLALSLCCLGTAVVLSRVFALNSQCAACGKAAEYCACESRSRLVVQVVLSEPTIKTSMSLAPPFECDKPVTRILL